MSEDYYKTKESVQEYIKLAKDVNGKELIEKLKSFLPAKSTLLEIGTGPGTDWKILAKDFDVVGSDNSKQFLDHLVAEYPKGRFLHADASQLLVDDTFDGIYSNKVLHHLSDEELMRSIQRQADILNERGIICHSFWKGDGSEIFKGLFVNYHQVESITNFFKNHFDILVLESYAEFDSGDSILLVGRKK